jgi:hypothetical protein
MKVRTMGSFLLGGFLLLAAAGFPGCAGTSIEDEEVGVATSAVTTTATCCQALPGTPQSFCDSLPQTPGRCNAANMGTSCTWVCPVPCCQALPGTPQSFCDSVPQTPGRCNAVNGGTSCTWTCP